MENMTRIRIWGWVRIVIIVLLYIALYHVHTQVKKLELLIVPGEGAGTQGR